MLKCRFTNVAKISRRFYADKISQVNSEPFYLRRVSKKQKSLKIFPTGRCENQMHEKGIPLCYVSKESCDPQPTVGLHCTVTFHIQMPFVSIMMLKQLPQLLPIIQYKAFQSIIDSIYCKSGQLADWIIQTASPVCSATSRNFSSTRYNKIHECFDFCK